MDSLQSLNRLVEHIPLPKMVELRQTLPRPYLSDVPQALREAVEHANVLDRIRPQAQVAITAGSRGVANIAVIIREIAALVQKKGGYPFIVPAMGSHGGATAKGQIDVLHSLGITEDFCGCPIRSSMETVQLGTTDAHGFPVHVDALAHHADATILVGRIKTHPSFRGKVESGLAKMAVIGLGNQTGASFCHQMGMKSMSQNIQEISSQIFQRSNIIFGVGLIENAFDETAEIAVIPAEQILEEEPRWLLRAKSYQPSLPFPKYDVLLVDEVGKNISGAGMDTDLISRYTNADMPSNPKQQVIAALNLTEATHGNAAGMGLIDLIPRHFFQQIDFANTYPNLLTSRVLLSAKMPMVLEDDRTVIKAAINCCTNINPAKPRLIHLKNTLEIGRLMISEALIEQARALPNVTLVGEPQQMQFDCRGNLISPF